jgi:hypothetical protein
MITETLFDDTYTGKRWHYGLLYRPVSAANLPPGWIIWSDKAHRRFPNFGTIDYPRALTQHEIDTFQLVPVGGLKG